MKSPPGGGISARPKRASSGPASRNEARIRSPSAGSIALASTSAPHSVSSFSPRHCTRTPRPSRISSIASTSRIRGTLPSVSSASVSTEAARIASAPFLLPAGTTVPLSGAPPWMTNFSIAGASGQAYTQTRRHPDPAPQTTAAKPREHEHTFCNSLATLCGPSALYSANSMPRQATAPARCRPFHPTGVAPYEHVFWRSPHPQASLRAVHRALDLARAALLLEPMLEDAHELVDARASHPHRTQRGAHPRRGVPERCWHVRSTASHRWSGRRPVAASSQDVADAGRQTGRSRTPPGLCRLGSPGEWGAARARAAGRPAANSSEPRRGAGLALK